MRVGLISDTHDRVEAMAAAVRLLVDRGVQYILHCGDLGSRRALEPLGEIPSGFVWGDVDRDRMGMLRYAGTLQIQCFGVLGDFTLEDKRFALVHGDDKKLVKKLISEGNHDYVLHGHTTEAKAQKVGRTHVISPGAIFGGAEKTVAILDTGTDQVEFIPVPKSEEA